MGSIPIQTAIMGRSFNGRIPRLHRGDEGSIPSRSTNLGVRLEKDTGYGAGEVGVPGDRHWNVREIPLLVLHSRPNRRHMSGFEYIRKTYGVPAKRHAIVYHCGQMGYVTSAINGRVRVKLFGYKLRRIFHPYDLMWLPHE